MVNQIMARPTYGGLFTRKSKYNNYQLKLIMRIIFNSLTQQ